MTGTRHRKVAALLALFLLYFVPALFGDDVDSLSTDEFTVEFSADKNEYITWNRLRLYLTVEGTSPGMDVDVYLGIALPDGTLFGLVPDLSFSGLNVEKGVLYPIDLARPDTLIPAMSAFSSREGEVFERKLVYRAILAHGLGLPEGEYQTIALLCHSGT
ncbi:MAG: hypothetical protein JW941_05795, partial [Candidatus Coatesbacteria bacterium]|nr:hypothetical protein [Candidatus Coatesbacteria bacterium]